MMTLVFRNLGLEAASGLQAIQPRQIEIHENKVGFRNRESDSLFAVHGFGDHVHV